jgi:hypothetical protein
MSWDVREANGTPAGPRIFAAKATRIPTFIPTITSQHVSWGMDVTLRRKLNHAPTSLDGMQEDAAGLTRNPMTSLIMLRSLVRFQLAPPPPIATASEARFALAPFHQSLLTLEGSRHRAPGGSGPRSGENQTARAGHSQFATALTN